MVTPKPAMSRMSPESPTSGGQSGVSTSHPAPDSHTCTPVAQADKHCEHVQVTMLPSLQSSGPLVISRLPLLFRGPGQAVSWQMCCFWPLWAPRERAFWEGGIRP